MLLIMVSFAKGLLKQEIGKLVTKLPSLICNCADCTPCYVYDKYKLSFKVCVDADLTRLFKLIQLVRMSHCTFLFYSVGSQDTHGPSHIALPAIPTLVGSLQL